MWIPWYLLFVLQLKVNLKRFFSDLFKYVKITNNAYTFNPNNLPNYSF